VPQVGILVLEDDPQNSGALKQILDSEGWRVRIVPDVPMLHAELKTGEYSLLIANIALIGVESPTFQVLRELAGWRRKRAGGSASCSSCRKYRAASSWAIWRSRTFRTWCGRSTCTISWKR